MSQSSDATSVAAARSSSSTMDYTPENQPPAEAKTQHPIPFSLLIPQNSMSALETSTEGLSMVRTSTLKVVGARNFSCVHLSYSNEILASESHLNNV